MTASDAVRSTRPRELLSPLATVIATGFGSGYSPLAPGTAGSAVGLALYWPLHRLPETGQLAAAAVVFIVGVLASGHVAARAGEKDPGLVVIDEVVGMWTSLLLLPLTVTTAAVGFFAFRIMDVLKPWPARQLESLRGGWGIMADDLMAGVYANLLVRIALLVFSA